ncbi:MAG: hypothetical protein OEV73_06740 [Desulfobulbaceae bacterium]|nr:hypothetical protein [Desulfobulbaceae bacterium]
MPRHLVALFSGLLLCCVWLSAAQAAGTKIAVIPLQDLSQGDDGVNWPLTDQLRQDLLEKNLDVVSQPATVSYLARHRIRTLGQLETYHIRTAKKDLEVSLILLGTVCQKTEQPGPSLSLVLYLLRTEDGQTIWSNTTDLCCSDTRRILGISEPKTIEDLYPLISHNILSSWPTNIGLQAKQLQSVDIESAWLRPTYLRSGMDAQCSVHLRSTWLPQNHPEVLLKIGENLIPVTETSGGDYYEFSWKAQGPDGRYPVSLITAWPDGHKQSLLLGSYFIDNQAPALNLELKGTLIDDKITFRNRLAIIPNLTSREPLNRWRITFENQNGESMVSQDGSGFPPERLFWQGKDDNGKPFPDGDYRITFEIWDRAENSAQASQWVTVLRSKPQLSVKAELSGDNGLTIDLAQTGKAPVSFWRMTLRDSEGITIAMKEGDHLPAKIALTVLPKDRNKKIKGFLLVRDLLGNQTQMQIADLFSLTKTDQNEKTKADEDEKNKAWVEEF